MNLLTIEDIAKSFGERQLFADVNLRINVGDRIGVIGVNGSGKTTLLRIAAGLEQPDQGAVTVWGGVKRSYLPQEPQVSGRQSVLEFLYEGETKELKMLRQFSEVGKRLAADPENPELLEALNRLTDEMDRTGSWAAEAAAKAILSRLGIDDAEVILDQLSGGQRKRVALARVLMEPADLLILDEPTNHIDAGTVVWLEDHLMRFPGALLMVTHDRYFLERVVNRIEEIDRRSLTSYPGSYRKYLEMSSQRQDQLTSADKKRQKLLKRELEWVRRSPMARGTKQKARKQRIEELKEIERDTGQDSLVIALASRRLGKKVLEARNLGKSFGERSLFRGIDFELAAGDRIGIVGPNGAGKSTFLNILDGSVESDSGAIEWGKTVNLGYYDQMSRGLQENKRVIDFINDAAALIRTAAGRRIEAAQMLEWFLFPRPQQQAQISSLSGGERRRLYLLWVLVQQPNVLFIDEPTNDLDIATLQVLEEFLDRFLGSLVVVSHDRYFLDRNVDYLISLENGVMSGRIPGPFDRFLEHIQKQEGKTGGSGRTPQPRKQTKTTAAKPAGSEANGSKPVKLTWKEARELEELETEIVELEAQKMRVEEAINNAGSDYERLQELADQLQYLDELLQARTERWLALAEIGG